MSHKADFLEEELVELCQQLIRIKTVNPPGDEETIAEFAAQYLQEAGLSTEIIRHSPGRASLLATLKGDGTQKPLILTGHLDTVPVGAESWKYDPFGGELAEDKIWGRGSSDMKSGVAVIMAAAKVLAKTETKLKGDVILALTAGEEVDSLGALAMAGRPEMQNAQGLLVSEPSSNEIFIGEKGALWVELRTFGKTAHGSMPDLGHNAILMMSAFLNAFQNLNIPFETDPLLGGFSCSVNMIRGGVKTNVVPDYCELSIDMRTVPGQVHQDILNRLQEILAALERKDPAFKAQLKVINDRQPVKTPPDHPLVLKFNKALAKVSGKPSALKGVRYYTDGAAFVAANPELPMLICGPGEAGLAHQPNEFVETEKLTECLRIYVAAIQEILG